MPARVPRSGGGAVEPPPRPRPAVMMDVARLAGVSHQTVSRVLNEHPSVSSETRERVLTAIAQLGYRRNTAARALVTRQSHTLGVVSVDTSHYGPASTLFGIEEAARRAGYFVTFASLRLVDRTHMRAALDHLMAANVDGIIVIAPLLAAVEAVHGLSSDVPLVMVTADADEAGRSVVVDQVLGARLATRHLLDLGHRTVHHVRGSDNWLEADARVDGWRTELAAAGVPAPELLRGDWNPRSGYEAGRELLRRRAAGADVSAVFVANDQMALGVLRALAEAGLRIPADVSVVGFDDIPEAGFFSPPLTTVRQDFVEVGRRCIGRLVAMIAGTPTGDLSAVEPTLLVRSSTAPPAPGPPSGAR